MVNVELINANFLIHDFTLIHDKFEDEHSLEQLTNWSLIALELYRNDPAGSAQLLVKGKPMQAVWISSNYGRVRPTRPRPTPPPK